MEYRVLERLKFSLTMEYRVLWCVPVAVIADVLGYTTVSFAIVGLGAALIMLTNFVFSVVVTAIFLQPLITVLSVKTGDKYSDMDTRLRRTIRWTLAGTVVAVGTSTLLCKCSFCFEPGLNWLSF